MDALIFSILCKVKRFTRYPNFTTSVRTVKLSFKKFGEPPSILIIHGLLGNKTLWEAAARTISNITKESVMTLDVRNHGDSEHTSSHKYMECAKDVQKLMGKQKVKKAMILGYCMGGRIAMSLSLMKPELVAGLIVVEISPVSTCQDFLIRQPQVMETMKTVDFSKLKKNEVDEAHKYTRKQLRDEITDDYLMKKILSNIGIRNGMISWTCNLDSLLKNIKYIAAFPKPLLSNVYEGPTKFIGGQQSDYIPPDDLPRIRELFPKSTVTYIPKTGHNVHFDAHKEFSELVVKFIKSNRNSST
ncbi:alpha/beta hydrolase fold domain-containing protein [Phthorimaea operculella]|nr:alpha/beta hydrolase fold domain-containing protein [Phthorimaea operculella]